jgi:hypothetical protein
MSKIIGTEIRVGHAQRLSKLIKTWLEINVKSFAKRSTVKFREHLFSNSWAVIFSQTVGQTVTWMGDSLGYKPRKKSRRRTKDWYLGQCLGNFIVNNSTNLQPTQYYGYNPSIHNSLSQKIKKKLYVSGEQGSHHQTVCCRNVNNNSTQL